MDGKELIAPSDAHLQQQQQQPFYTQHQHRMQHQLAGAAAGGQHLQHQQHNNNHHHSSLSSGMHHSVIRPMPNMSMSPTAILQSIGGMQFQMDGPAPSPSSSSTLMHNAMQQQQQQQGSVSGSGAMPTQHLPPEPVIKRKRGRPRKYGPDGAMKAAAAQAQQQQQMMSAPPRTMGSTMPGGHVDMAAGLEDSAQMKKRRGRPPGTGKKLSSSSSPVGNAFAGSAGTSFTPHIITASPSEDVAGKIAAFANQSPWAVCVLSAMGSVSRVVLRHPADHHAAVSRPLLHHHAHASAAPHYKNPAVYEGLYEILSLSGSYNLHEGAGAAQQQITESQQQEGDGLSVTLCSPERHVIGGVIAGALVAATTVQVVLGSFVHGGSRAKSKKAGKQPAAFSADSLTGGGSGGGGGQDTSPSSAGHVNQSSLTPSSVVTTGGGWPSSGIFDTRSSNIDINSSRG